MIRIAGCGDALVIASDNADIETCLNVAVPTKFPHAGKVSVTGDRFDVRDRLHDAFVKGIRDYLDVKPSQRMWS
jgi:acyl-CoA reductase-like NAD-dependent aldehyde dehydrogenase